MVGQTSTPSTVLSGWRAERPERKRSDPQRLAWGYRAREDPTALQKMERGAPEAKVVGGIIIGLEGLVEKR